MQPRFGVRPARRSSVRSAAWIMAHVRATGRRDLLPHKDVPFDPESTQCRKGALLSAQQQAIMRAVVNGQSQGDVSVRLGLTSGSVNVQIKRVMKKLGVADMSAAKLAFLEMYGHDETAPGLRTVSLSPQETRVLQERAKGYRRQAIAKRLQVTAATVEQAQARARAKLGVGTTDEAQELAIRHGLIADPAKVSAA